MALPLPNVSSAKASISTTQRTGLRRHITGPLLFLFILGDVLGAGIYALMGMLAATVGGALWAPMLLALLLALLTAGSYAVLVTKYPKAGGAAIFAERAYGQPVVSFLVGFAMLAAGITSAAGLALAISGTYMSAIVDVPQLPAALIFLLLVACLNARGISESMKGNMVMTLIEVSGLVIVIVAGAMVWASGTGDVSRVTQFPSGVHPATATLGAAIIAYYAFVGFETSANVAEEVKEPHKVYPAALFGALLVAGLVYVLVGLAVGSALPAGELAASKAPLLAVVEASDLNFPSWLYGLIALVAVANGCLLTMIMSSRLAFGMAEQRLLPTVLARLLPNRGTPWVAIAVTTLASMALAVMGNLQALAETVVLLLLGVFISTNVAVLVLRKDKVAPPHFQVWSIIPVLGIASCLLLLMQQTAQVWLFGAGFLVLGLALYMLARWATRRKAAPSDQAATA